MRLIHSKPIVTNKYNKIDDPRGWQTEATERTPRFAQDILGTFYSDLSSFMLPDQPRSE